MAKTDSMDGAPNRGPNGRRRGHKRPPSPARDAATQRPDRKLRANSRTYLQREADKAFLTKWILRGLSGEALIEKLAEHHQVNNGGRRISRAQFYADVKQIQHEWKRQREQDIPAMRDRELQKLNLQESELWEQWERSKEDAQRVTQHITEDGSVDETGKFTGKRKTVKSMSKEARAGSVEIMNTILRVQALRARILGYEAPVKHQHSNSDGTPLAAAAVAPIIHVTIAAPVAE